MVIEPSHEIFFFVFPGPHPQHMEVPRLEVKLELQLPAYTTATATWDRATSVTYTTAHGNAGSLSHWVRPGIKPASSCMLFRFVSAEPWREFHELLISYLWDRVPVYLSWLLFSVLLMLWHLGPCWPWKDCPSQGQPIPRDGKWLTYEHVCIIQTPQNRAHIPTTSFLELSHSVPSLIPQSQVPNYQKQPFCISLLKFFTLANPKFVYLALFIPSHRSHNKALVCIVHSPSASCMVPACFSTPWHGMLCPSY